MAGPLIAHARAGEPLDALLHRTIGRTAGAVEAVLAANPGLSASARLTEGQAVTIPAAAATPPAAPLIDLWD